MNKLFALVGLILMSSCLGCGGNGPAPEASPPSPAQVSPAASPETSPATSPKTSPVAASPAKTSSPATSTSPPASPTAAFPNPGAFPTGSPEQVAARVIQVWSQKNWAAMSGFASQSWRKANPGSHLVLQKHLEGFVPVQTTAFKVVERGSELVTLSATLKSATGNRQVSIQLVRESGAWRLAPDTLLK